LITIDYVFFGGTLMDRKFEVSRKTGETDITLSIILTVPAKVTSPRE